MKKLLMIAVLVCLGLEVKSEPLVLSYVETNNFPMERLQLIKTTKIEFEWREEPKPEPMTNIAFLNWLSATTGCYIITATNCLATNTLVDWYDIETIREKNIASNLVTRLAKAGEICKVFGHQWREGRRREGESGWYADNHPGIFYRTCKICEQCQSEKIEWKDVP